MFCRNCGTELKEEARFCPECGTPVIKSQGAWGEGVQFREAPSCETGTAGIKDKLVGFWKRRTREDRIVIVLVALVLGIVIFFGVAKKADRGSSRGGTNTKSHRTQEKEPVYETESYRTQAEESVYESVDLKSLKQYPDTYEGKYVQVTGSVGNVFDNTYFTLEQWEDDFSYISIVVDGEIRGRHPLDGEEVTVYGQVVKDDILENLRIEPHEIYYWD